MTNIVYAGCWRTSLIWKGLRLECCIIIDADTQLENFPDLEGIKTDFVAHFPKFRELENFPDLEGIKTSTLRCLHRFKCVGELP